MADPAELREWEAEFEAAARRPLRTRVRYAFRRLQARLPGPVPTRLRSGRYPYLGGGDLQVRRR